MKAIQQVTHNHKRAGAVVVLQSTEGLAKVLIPTSGEEFWVKRDDLTELVAGGVAGIKSSKKESRADHSSVPPQKS
jgi:hypothetical protein